MKEINVGATTKLLQVFLEKEPTAKGAGISEVSVTHPRVLHCTCPDFSPKKFCKHATIVDARLDSEGKYPFSLLKKHTLEEVLEAEMSNEKYRAFIMNYGEIELI